MARNPAPRGRPPAVSRETLQDAAFDLFIEKGYERTTVDDIARPAGVGRSTFVNHFGANSDVFWIELDAAAAVLENALDGAESPSLHAVRGAILRVGDSFGPDSVPFVLTQSELIGSVAELQAAAFSRLAHHARLIGDHLVAA